MKLINAIPTFGAILVVYLLALLVFAAVTNDAAARGRAVSRRTPATQPAAGSNGEAAKRLMAYRVLTIELPSKADFSLTIGDIVISIGLFFLFIEIIKSTGSSDTTIVEHVLSTFVLIFYILCFLLVEIAGNSTFLLLGLMSMIDVVAGITISISTARRDISMG